LANATSHFDLLDDFIIYKFFVELIFGPSILENISNWRIFNDDQQIVEFVSSESTFHDTSIDDEEHTKTLEKFQDEMKDLKSDVIPRNVVTLEKLFYM
jgi:hypothetical protein